MLKDRNIKLKDFEGETLIWMEHNNFGPLTKYEYDVSTGNIRKLFVSAGSFEALAIYEDNSLVPFAFGGVDSMMSLTNLQTGAKLESVIFNMRIGGEDCLSIVILI